MCPEEVSTRHPDDHSARSPRGPPGLVRSPSQVAAILTHTHTHSSPGPVQSPSQITASSHTHTTAPQALCGALHKSLHLHTHTHTHNGPPGPVQSPSQVAASSHTHPGRQGLDSYQPHCPSGNRGSHPRVPPKSLGSPAMGSHEPAVDEEADSCQHQEQDHADSHTADHCHVARPSCGCRGETRA